MNAALSEVLPGLVLVGMAGGRQVHIVACDLHVHIAHRNLVTGNVDP